jgi:hypothetical protein
MRYNHLLALPLAAGLLSAASGLTMAATPNGVIAEQTKLGFAAATVAPAAPSYVRLAMDDSPGSYDKHGRVERAERDRFDRPSPEYRPTRPERSHR